MCIFYTQLSLIFRVGKIQDWTIQKKLRSFNKLLVYCRVLDQPKLKVETEYN